MKYFVLSIVGMWSAFLTIAQSFGAWENLLVLSHFSTTAIGIVAILTSLIGFGYTMLFIALLDVPIPRMKTLSYCLGCGAIVIMLYLIITMTHRTLLMDLYTSNTILKGIGFGNTVLLGATTLWWLLIGLVLTLICAPTKNRTWIKRLEVSRSIR